MAQGVGRESIISALNRIEPLEAEGSPPRPLSLSELEEAAAVLVQRYRLSRTRTFDLTGLQRELLEVLLGGRLTPASAALLLAHALAPVPIAERAALALYLVNAIRGEKIELLSQVSLGVLKRAASFADPDVAQPVIRRLDEELSRRPASFIRRGEVLLAADRVSDAQLDALYERLLVRDRQLSQIVVVLNDSERVVGEDVILAHLAMQSKLFGVVEVGEIDALVRANLLCLIDAVTLVPASRPGASAQLRQAMKRARRALLDALEPFAPVELMARGG
jgi:hypothetical protein